MSSGELNSAGLWLMPPLRLRTKSIPAGTPALARMPASWPAPEGSSSTGRPSACTSARRAARISSDIGDGSVRIGSSTASAAASRSSRWASGARASTLSRTRPGMTFVPPGSTVTWPTVATAPSIPRATSRARRTNSAASTSASSRTSIGVVPAWPGVPSNVRIPRT